VELLVIKTGALGDVVRTTSILPGMKARHPSLRVTWLTARGAEDLVRHHPLVDIVVAIELRDPGSLARVHAELARPRGSTRWGRVLSLDDERELCRLAYAVGGDGSDGVLSGAYETPAGELRYTPDVASWFDMGLLSVHGKREADRRKLENRASHAALYARMLGIEMGAPELPLPRAARDFGVAFAERTGVRERRPVIGLNTGSGGRWESKKLPEDRTVELAAALGRALDGRATFLVCGGPEEAERNARIGRALDARRLRWVDAGTGNSLLEFTALVAACDLLITSDSLALHLAVTQRVPILAFFAPTPAHEIELYGRGETVHSTAPDYASYRKDADTSTLTVERLCAAALRVLAAHPPR
jgi:heptosyltransferase-2